MSASDHWQGIAHQWEHVGPPLKPSKEDLAHYWQSASSWNGGPEPRVLILGVTQELFTLPWPQGSRVRAIDHTQAMIDQVWLGAKEDATCGDWTAMPFETSSFDIALCDGGLTLVTYPAGVALVASELHRVLVEGGICVFRLYAPVCPHEEPDFVLRELASGRIPDLSQFKLRIANAMQSNPREGAVLGEIRRTLEDFAPDLDALADSIGWPREHLRAIETYRDSPIVYRFIPSDSVCEIFEREGLRFVEERTSSSAMGCSCPLVVFRREPA